MICPRCGNEMNNESRYCMKCGYLNPSNEENKNMQQFISENNNALYQIGSGQVINQNTNTVTNSIASNTGNKRVCFLINYLIYMFIIVLSYILILGGNAINFEIVKNSLFPYVAFITSIIFLYTYSMQLIVMKSNRKWWYALIPFYNLFVLADMVFNKKWLGILFFIPVVGQVFYLVVLYVLGTKFKYNGILSMLLPIIYIPMMGFGTRLYEGVNYIGEERTLEKDYKRKKIFFISLMIFLILGFVLIFWTNIIEVKSKAKKITNYYYVYATHQIIDKTKTLANENYLLCDEEYIYNKGIYYIEYADISDQIFLPFAYMRDVIKGYVIIDNTSGTSKYFISISDGTYGYPETLASDITLDTIVPYEEVNFRNDINQCINNRPKLK